MFRPLDEMNSSSFRALRLIAAHQGLRHVAVLEAMKMTPSLLNS
jgi:hypothetical protein